MSQNHRRLYENDQIKIYNSSILDFNKPFNEACFVIGMEILDNMPHDRLFADEVPRDGSRIKYTKQSMIEISESENGKEVLKELKVPIDEHKDPLVHDFVRYLESIPEADHIQATSRLQVSGVIKQMKDMWSEYRYKDSIKSNIFAPTAAIFLFQHLHKIMPNHQIILADFDSFLTDDKIKGINAPLVTDKLEKPTEWDNYDDYLIPRG